MEIYIHCVGLILGNFILDCVMISDPSPFVDKEKKRKMYNLVHDYYEAGKTDAEASKIFSHLRDYYEKEYHCEFVALGHRGFER